MSRKAILSSLFLAATLILSHGTARAVDRGTGLGFIMGEPTGISGKFWLGGRTALDAALAWSTFDEHDDLHLQMDYVWHDFGLLSVDRGALPVYYGLGGRLATRDGRGGEDRLGVRFPVGLAYIFPSQRADLFFEVAPTLDLTPDTNVDVEGGLGVRYFFR